LLLILIGLLVIANCGGKEPASDQKDNPGYVTGLAKMGKLATDPFTQMSLEFDGNPAQETIQEKLDPVLARYGMELNNTNRVLAAKILTALRKEQGHSEMDILEKMQTAPTNDEKFDDAARRVSTGMNP
jgi:hypothetical protein